MASQSNLKKFNRIYDKTYSDILKYVIIHCHNINDVNDIVQDVYVEFWKILNKKEIDEENIKSFLIGISINKIKKYYTLMQRIKALSLFEKNDNDVEIIDTLKDNLDIEALIIKNDDWNRIWEYIKKKKNPDISKIFYLHYKMELSIKDISKELSVNESYIKNLIYRTLKELYSLFGKGCN